MCEEERGRGKKGRKDKSFHIIMLIFVIYFFPFYFIKKQIIIIYFKKITVEKIYNKSVF